ncbi:hypothetical protein BCR33DRAFT_717265 [Rhizoclosmatium globosum]|uniref:Uncharacterized protein n=1 Tax=Rhizoclosmatium globosum TaxID=329046 RepID=A0A1Y2CAY8_9FUNG|nr:hypothetical protein BCR33DRAFT_717265 [Rhizoclosmatium globosum]|eukprot:ORY44193.1 hypothetical protein BCR33DRAFT_717265 [Rhizoclosmatium globosum]
MEPRFYSASVQIPHSGSYSLSVSVVAEAFRWNAYNESNIWPWKRLEKAVLNVDGDTVIKVEVLKGGSGKSASNTCDLARIYNATNVIQKGWPLSELLPGYWAQLPMMLSIETRRGNTKPLLTGSTFIPTQCSLRAFTAHQGRMCLIEKYPVIHWFGDSNSRRAIKFLDVRDGGWRGFLGKDGREVCEDGNGGSGRLFLGVVVLRIRSWGRNLTNAVFSWRRVLDRSDWWNVVSMSLKRREKVSLVVAAFEDVDGWSERVRAFARGLKEMYREMEGVRFVFRTAQPACPVTEWGQYRHRRYTPARNEMFRTLGAMIFKEELNADIWDIGIVNSNQDMCEQFHCPSNHAHPSVVALENQLLFNLIC